MATKRQLCVEMFGLWEDQRGMLPNLASLVEPEMLLTSNNHALKVIGEALNILNQDMSAATKARIAMLDRRIVARGVWLDNVMEHQKAAITRNLDRLDILLPAFPLLLDAMHVRNDIDKDSLATLRLTNVHKANAHVVDNIARGRVSSGSNGNSHNLPAFTFGQDYHVVAHGQDVIFKAVSEKDWIVLNGDDLVSSVNYPELAVTSWTGVSRILRCLKADYTSRKEGFTVPQGRLDHAHFSQIKSGGVKPLVVDKI